MSAIIITPAISASSQTHLVAGVRSVKWRTVKHIVVTLVVFCCPVSGRSINTDQLVNEEIKICNWVCLPYTGQFTSREFNKSISWVSALHIHCHACMYAIINYNKDILYFNQLLSESEKPQKSISHHLMSHGTLSSLKCTSNH